LVQLEHALHDGRIEEAVEVAASVRLRDPQHVAAAQWSADVAELTWRDDDAVRDLTAALKNCRVDGREMPGEAEVHGRLGDILFGAVPVLVIDDAAFELRDLYSDPHRDTVRVPRAVLGLDLLGSCRLTLDPERKSVVLELPRGLPAEQSVQCVRVEGRCLVPVFVEDVRMWLVLDTGASRSSLAEA